MYENPLNYMDFTDPEAVIRETLDAYEDEYNCKPSVIEVVTLQDEETGEFKEQKVYNCNNCINYDCPYFYEIGE